MYNYILSFVCVFDQNAALNQHNSSMNHQSNLNNSTLLVSDIRFLSIFRFISFSNGKKNRTFIFSFICKSNIMSGCPGKCCIKFSFPSWDEVVRPNVSFSMSRLRIIHTKQLDLFKI